MKKILSLIVGLILVSSQSFAGEVAMSDEALVTGSILFAARANVAKALVSAKIPKSASFSNGTTSTEVKGNETKDTIAFDMVDCGVSVTGACAPAGKLVVVRKTIVAFASNIVTYQVIVRSLQK